MADPRLLRLVDELRTTRFAELAGAQVSATIPVSARLLNELMVALIPPGAPVRSVKVQLQAGNRLALRVKLARLEFLPPVTVTLEVEQQPKLPDSPLVLRVLSLPGLASLAGAAASLTTVLPPGVRLQDQRLFVDPVLLLRHHGYGEILPYLHDISVTTDADRLVLTVDARVRGTPDATTP